MPPKCRKCKLIFEYKSIDHISTRTSKDCLYTHLRPSLVELLKKKSITWLSFLPAGVLVAVPAPLDCRRQAFAGQNTPPPPLFRVCAVPVAAVRYAGLPLASCLLVGAAAKHAFAWTAAIFCAEALAGRGGGAARHGARLLLSAAVFATIRSARVCVCGASCKLARSMRAMIAHNQIE